ncbi:coiled-coil domain-containing protein 191 [Rhinatrema bivittatum]|uniref:coiled-coil domain-containing protein 191 n=1 Tax=Rhinatrema bivittatum TaxID=194408 RepID=UPI00112D0092|nr:coiled-coil domain-containing protein 191 [Rhinatrema bivittatum]
MLIAMKEMACSGKKKAELFRWKRFTKKEKPKPGLDYDNVEHWIKRVEQASEFAVSEVFSIKKTDGHRRPVGPVMNLETTSQLQEHDDAYGEAQDLLRDWMNSKLRLELASDDEDGMGKFMEEQSLPEEVPAGFLKYNRFDDLYGYLEQEVESSTVQDFMQQLLQKEVIDSGILEDFRAGDDREKKKRKDPRLAMELRHQQVKENRIRRQKELEHQKQERALKKSLLSEAQLLVQEESKRKVLKARKEEEDIQREMVKLRKEMSERKRIMEEAWKTERKRQELDVQKPSAAGQVHAAQCKPVTKKREMQKEQLARIQSENTKCLQQHFSAWYKMILERRIKTGKARALADWKCQLQAFRAWRDHAWAKKMERETQKLEMDLKEQNRKQQLATQCDRKRLLRHSFVEWQSWCRAEREMRELEVKKEATKRKMVALLEAASASLGSPCDPDKDQGSKNGQVPKRCSSQGLESQSAEGERQEEVMSARAGQGSEVSTGAFAPTKPKHAWQITLQHAALSPEELAQCRARALNAPQRLQDTQARPAQRRAPVYGSHFENRHAFQQQLIEEQRRQLLEQREMILELKESQRLMRLQREAEQATAVTKELTNQVSRSKALLKKGSQQEREDLSSLKSLAPLSSPVPSYGLDNSQADTARRTPGHLTSPHPMLKGMEERAAQRAERRKELEELKRKREEEKLAHLKAEEEERQQKEAAEKEAQIERKREERRLQKQKELEKQKLLEWQQQLRKKAEDHYHRVLLRRQGLEPWRRLMVQAKQRMAQAEEHHCLVLQRRSLLAWLQQVRESLTERRDRAEGFYSHLLLRRSFRNWLKYKDCLSLLEERADWFFKDSLKKTTFLAWLNLVNEERVASWEKQRIAAEHYHRRVKLTMFTVWRKFPKLLKEEKQREERREQLRKKVAEILPDFRL